MMFASGRSMLPVLLLLSILLAKVAAVAPQTEEAFIGWNGETYKPAVADGKVRPRTRHLAANTVWAVYAVQLATAQVSCILLTPIFPACSMLQSAESKDRKRWWASAYSTEAAIPAHRFIRQHMLED